MRSGASRSMFVGVGGVLDPPSVVETGVIVAGTPVEAEETKG